MLIAMAKVAALILTLKHRIATNDWLVGRYHAIM